MNIKELMLTYDWNIYETILKDIKETGILSEEERKHMTPTEIRHTWEILKALNDKILKLNNITLTVKKRCESDRERRKQKLFLNLKNYTGEYDVQYSLKMK